MKKLYILIFSFFSFLFLTGCADMLDTDSELVEFERDNQLNQPTDSVYSVMGIINKMQVIADRTILLGEVRGDLMIPTDAASTDLKNLFNFDFEKENKYNKVSDYYAVINNCNYVLAHLDTTMSRRGRNLFMPEYAVVKTFRAWTYLQLALIYGKVPLVLKPLMTENEAQEAMNQSRVGLSEICDYFISDLTPYTGIDLPKYGNVDGWDSQQFFIPLRVLLGDLCLWSGRYLEAATWYHDFLTDKRDPIKMSASRSTWPTVNKYENPKSGYSTTSTEEILSFIPMETRIFDGVVSDIQHLFNSTRQNNYYYQVTASQAMANLSKAQTYVIQNYVSSTQTDTVEVPKTGMKMDAYVGDLRYSTNFNLRSYGSNNEYSEYNSYDQTISKVWSSMVPLYRRTTIYLRYAEALNRAGLPQSAMCVLKHGMCEKNTKAYVDAVETAKAGDLIYFDPTVYKLDNGKTFGASDYQRTIYGVHSLGSGDAHANKAYDVPQPPTALATRQDTVDYQVPLVEKMIIDEMALEGAFEGLRFYDLVRLALRTNNPSVVANAVANRKGTLDAELQTKLMNPDNWYLPLPKK